MSSSNTYRRKLDPYRSLRQALGAKGVRQSVVVTNNPSTIDQNQQLLVRFPNLGSHDVVAPGTARFSVTVTFNSTDANRTLVNNIGHAIIKETTLRVSGYEVLPIEDSDVYHYYLGLWKMAQERDNSAYHWIDSSAGWKATKLRIENADAIPAVVEDSAISTAFYRNRFSIHLDTEILESHMPFHHSGLGCRLEYELTFNSHARVIRVAGHPKTACACFPSRTTRAVQNAPAEMRAWKAGLMAGQLHYLHTTRNP